MERQGEMAGTGRNALSLVPLSPRGGFRRPHGRGRSIVSTSASMPGSTIMRDAWSRLFARKPVEALLQEAEGGERLRRVLGPVALTCLGLGATIGTGIFVLTGEAAARYAGPSLMLSFVLAAIGCGFAALCYSELASMVPVAGSAYTYAYATLGEIFAWIIGWDLILEYAFSNMS